MEITEKELEAVNQIGFIASRIDDLKHMTLQQWMMLAGYAIAGAVAGYATDPTPLGAGLGALGGVFAHLVPLMSSSPHDAAKADQAIKAVEAQGAAAVKAADPSKPADQAAADFAKAMKS